MFYPLIEYILYTPVSDNTILLALVIYGENRHQIILQLISLKYVAALGIYLTLLLMISGSQVNDLLIALSYSKTCVKLPLSKKTKIVFQDQL